MVYIEKHNTGSACNELTTIHLRNGSYDIDVCDNLHLNITIRTDILKKLLVDQKYCCAYCMKEINVNNATIEHIISQNFNENSQGYNYQELVRKYKVNIENILGRGKSRDINIGRKHDTNYLNMLAVCKGNTCGNSSHCDASRSKKQDKRPLLFISPLDRTQMENIKFSYNGTIYYKEPLSEKELKELSSKHSYLNLDMDTNIKYDLNYVLNLNCEVIREKRKRVLGAIRNILSRYSFDRVKIRNYLQAFEDRSSLYYSFNQNNGEFSRVAIFELKKHI